VLACDWVSATGSELASFEATGCTLRILRKYRRRRQQQ